jgi:hypothetical protein
LKHRGFIVALAVSAFLPAHAQSVEPPSPPPLAEPAPCCTLPALTEVSIEFLTTINSQANQIGEHFPIKLAEPIIVNGQALVPAGTPGSGDVVHAAKSRFGGKPGELILAVRYLELNGIRIPLRSLRYDDGRGKDNGDSALALAAAGGVVGGVISMFVTGGEVTIPTGTKAFAKTSAAVTLAPPASTIGQ